MEAFYRTHAYLVEHTNAPVRRDLMDEIDWNDRLIGIKGTRGVGKTTFLLQYAKEKFGTDRSCLFINMNNFYFSGHGIVEFAAEFQRRGGKVLLIDQVFKYPEWSKELRMCYDRFPNLKIVFTGSSVMRLKEENMELRDIVKSYNLRGFSFREYLNLQTGMKFHAYPLEEILSNHEQIAKGILSKVRPLDYMQDYMHHGFYPLFPRKAQFLGESAEDDEHDGGSGHPAHQTNRAEISVKDKKITIFASCGRTRCSERQPAGHGDSNFTCHGDELH